MVSSCEPQWSRFTYRLLWRTFHLCSMFQTRSKFIWNTIQTISNIVDAWKPLISWISVIWRVKHQNIPLLQGGCSCYTDKLNTGLYEPVPTNSTEGNNIFSCIQHFLYYTAHTSVKVDFPIEIREELCENLLKTASEFVIVHWKLLGSLSKINDSSTENGTKWLRSRILHFGTFSIYFFAVCAKQRRELLN